MSQLKLVASLVLGVIIGLCLGQSYRSGVAEQAFAQPGNGKEPNDQRFAEKKRGELKATDLVALAKARVELARKAYEGVTKNIGMSTRIGNMPHPLAMPEEAYLWSVRWLSAERDMNRAKDNQVAALKNHLARMKHLQQRVSGMAPLLSEIGGPLAARYFVAEAESWLAEEKAKGR